MSETEIKSRGRDFALLGAAVIFAAAIGGWVFLGGGDTQDSGAYELGVTDDFRPEVGQLAPDFVLVDARDPNNTIRLSDFRGTPVVLNWFAVWCAPCRQEIPDFRDAYNAFDGDLIILGVSLQESSQEAIGLLDEFDANYPAVLDSTGSVFAHYRGIGMPTTYFIDKDGIIVENGTGRVNEAALVNALAKVGLVYEPVEDN